MDGAADVPPHVAVLVRQDDASDMDGEPFRPAHGAEALGAGAAPLPPPLPLAASGTLRAGSKATSDAETLAYLLKPGLLPSVQFYGVLQQVRFPTHPLLLPSLPPLYEPLLVLLSPTLSQPHSLTPPRPPPTPPSLSTGGCFPKRVRHHPRTPHYQHLRDFACRGCQQDFHL